MECLQHSLGLSLASHISPWKFISHGCTTVKSIIPLIWEMGQGSHVNSWEVCWARDFPFRYNFSCLHRLFFFFYTILFPVIVIMFMNLFFFHGISTFIRNSNDREFSELEFVLGLSDIINLYSNPKRKQE